jgi:hypothetical protein
MNILGFNRVELMMSPEDIHAAVEQFNDLLGTSFHPPDLLNDGNVLSTTDWDNHIELYGPAHSPTTAGRGRTSTCSCWVRTSRPRAHRYRS